MRSRTSPAKPLDLDLGFGWVVPNESRGRLLNCLPNRPLNRDVGRLDDGEPTT